MTVLTNQARGLHYKDPENFLTKLNAEDPEIMDNLSSAVKKYSSGELSNVADGAPAKEKPQADILKKYSQGEFSNVAEESNTWRENKTPTY